MMSIAAETVPPAVTFEVALTLADVREAQRPVTPEGQPVRRGGSFARGVTGWIVFGGLAGLLTFMLTESSASRPGPATVEPPAPTQNLWVTLAPSSAAAALLVVATAITAWGRWRLNRRILAAAAAGEPAPGPPKPSQTAGLLILSPLALIFLYRVPALAVWWSPSPGQAVCVAVLPWAAMLLLLVAIGRWTRRTAAETTWASNPGLRRPGTIIVSDAGVAADDGVLAIRYRWPAVARYRETDGLLLLTLEDTRVLILPKRALPDAATEDQLRGLIQTHVAEGTFMPRAAAFAVIPVSR